MLFRRPFSHVGEGLLIEKQKGDKYENTVAKFI
jgi:hypothetical protein